MSLSKNEILNGVYNAGLVTVGAVATSMVSRKLTKDGLGVTSSVQSIVKLAVAVGGGSLIVKYLQKKDYVPDEPLQINMASVVAGGLFNAIAFAGAGYVFHKLDKSGSEKEMKRHNEAMEKLTEEKEKWYKRTVEKKNRIAILRQKLLDADKDLDRVNKALHDLRTVTEELEEDKEPTLNEYYEPSEEMKTYMDIVTGAMSLGSGYLLTKIL